MEQEITTTDDVGISWWLWMARLRRDDQRHFLYACAAPTFRPAGWKDRSEQKLGGAAAVEIEQRTVTEDTFRRLRDRLGDGHIQLDILLGEPATPMCVVDRRTVFQDGFGHSGTRVELYYTLPDVRGIVGSDDVVLADVLSVLQAQLNLPFRDSYAKRLGNFEIFELHAWLDQAEPFLIEPIRLSGNDLAGPETMEICREPEFAARHHIAHVVGRVGGDVVLDRVVILEPGRLRVSVEAPARLDQLDFWMFDNAGETLLHSTHSSYLNRIHLALSPISRQMTIEDDLSRRAAQGKCGPSQGTIVQSYVTQRSQIGAPAKGSWRHFADEMTDWVAARLPAFSEDKWFPRGIEGEIGAIAHINHLLHGGSVRRAVLADPWFGVDALRRVALRLESRDVALTVVTSWTRTDPDTGMDLDEKAPIAGLETALSQIAPFLNVRLNLINLADGAGQAFHDRYLVLYMHEGPPKVFLLSNSLNKVAGNWPFAMTLVAPDVAREIRLYIEGLCDGRDIARGKSLTTTFRWPADAGKPAAAS